MLTKEQIESEKRREQNYNKISDSIIKVMPFGKLYGFMQTASKMGTSMLKKSVCVDPEGRLVASYKTDFGKISGAWLKPQHELMTENLAKKKYGKALLGSIPIIGQISRASEQKKMKKKGMCFDITIEEFMAEQKKRDELANTPRESIPSLQTNISAQSKPNDLVKKKFLGMPKSTGIVVTVLGLTAILGISIYIISKQKKA